MHSRFSYLTIASLAALAFSGCEWGGAHENTWNDGYSWADFTGTYRFVNALLIPASSGTDDGSGSGGDVSEVGKVTHTDGSGNAELTTTSSGSGTVSPVGVGIVPGSFTISALGVTDGGDGKLYKGSTVVGAVTYSTGAWSINGYVGKKGTFGISYNYETMGIGSSVNNSSSDPGQVTVPISYLNVIQQGNKFTMTGDSGMKYTGSITGSNVGRDDYQAARTIYISFEVSAANGQKITGNFSGVWSGASDKAYGTLSNRKVNGTHSRAGNFVGVAADKSIYVYDAMTSETGPSTYVEPSNQ